MKASHFSRVRFGVLAALVGACFFALPVLAGAVKVSYVPKSVQQANGSALSLYMSGDEYFNYLHTANGSLVREDSDGYFKYCVARFDGVLQPGTVRVDQNPVYQGLTVEEVDIEANAKAKDQMEHVLQYTQPKFSLDGRRLAGASPSPSLTKSDLNGIVIYIRFAGEAEFASTEAAGDDALLNTNTYSLNNYIKAQSEGTCSFTSVMPKGDSAVVTSFCPTQTRGYFQPYNATTNPLGYQTDNERDVREHILLQQAIAWTDAKSDLPSAANLDKNQDGAVDSVMFIVSGEAGEWSSLLWPHMWSMGTYSAQLNGVAVDNFSFELQNFSPSRKLSTYAHETMHVLGFPDLYRYYAAGDPIAMWDIMNADTQIPQYANAYMRKTIADWGPALGEAKIGENVVRAPSASGSEPESIVLPLSTQQSLVFEYRKNGGTSFDQMLPSSGLLPYRILTTAQANIYGNMYGPNYYPDGYYIFRPGVTAWGTIPWYDSAGYGMGASMGGGTTPSTWTLSSSNGRSSYGSPGVPADSFFAYGGQQVEYYVGDVGENTNGTISFKLNTINDFNNYTVTFNTDGGSAVPSQSIYANQVSTEPTQTPTREGYTFDGWFTSAEGTTTFDFANTKILKNTTVFAHWTQIPQAPPTVSVDVSGNTNSEKGQPYTLSGKIVKTASEPVSISTMQDGPRNSGALPGETAVPGVTVYLETSQDGGKTWAIDSSVQDVTDATGAFDLTFTPSTNMKVRAYVPAQTAGTEQITEMRTSAIALTITQDGVPIPASSTTSLVLLLVGAGGALIYAERKWAIVSK